MSLSARPAQPEDAPAITEIYNEGIEDRIATFETKSRTTADILPWFDHSLAFVSVTDAVGEVVGRRRRLPPAHPRRAGARDSPP